MLLLEGYLKQIALDRDVAALGGPAWSIRVTNVNGQVSTFLAYTWRLRHRRGVAVRLEGKGDRDRMLTPVGPAYWVETRMAIEADIPGAAWVDPRERTCQNSQVAAP